MFKFRSNHSQSMSSIGRSIENGTIMLDGYRWRDAIAMLGFLFLFVTWLLFRIPSTNSTCDKWLIVLHLLKSEKQITISSDKKQIPRKESQTEAASPDGWTVPAWVLWPRILSVTTVEGAEGEEADETGKLRVTWCDLLSGFDGLARSTAESGAGTRIFWTAEEVPRELVEDDVQCWDLGEGWMGWDGSEGGTSLVCDPVFVVEVIPAWPSLTATTLGPTGTEIRGRGNNSRGERE